MSASGARGDDALAAVEAKHPRRRRGGDLHPAFESDPAVDHTLVEQVHAVLDRADAIGDLAEVTDAEFLLILHTEGAVVGGDHLDVVGTQRLPELVLMLLGLRAQRCRADPLGPLEARGAEVVLQRQIEVLRARLAEDVLAVVAGRGDLGDCLLGGDVHDIQRRAGEIGEHDRPVRGFLFHLPRPRDAVEVGIGLAGLGQLHGKDVDGGAVLGVHHRHQSGRRGLLHRLQDGGVIAVEHARIGHEQLEAGHALVDEPVHGLEGGIVDLTDDLVEAVVDRAIAFGLAM
jgi:hypothetical protein